MTDRCQFRAAWHDYNDGIYFVTICCKDKSHYFGAIENGEMRPSIPGTIIDRQIAALPTHFPGLELLNHVIMPNHVHIILSVSPKPVVSSTPVGTLPVGTLFKASATAPQPASIDPTPQPASIDPTPQPAQPDPTPQPAPPDPAPQSTPPAPAPQPNLGCLKPKMHGPATADFHHNSILSVIVRCLKGGVTRECGRRNIKFAWQPRFHEHIIRNQQAFDNIMNYVDNNVANWHRDCFNPDYPPDEHGD
ncbi:transposase [uncultured Duncaniella sp.]|uniref:transposase n=1 Tax=uncultured Duncaniella sp. TaxID=2768039 RepID=UPI0026397B6B|nr:transposase [uncultured Duncaniella sp.]